MDFKPVIDSLGKILTDILDFIPSLINGLIILLIGYFISLLIRWILKKVLRSIRLDQLAERTGITGAIGGLGVKIPLSQIIAQIVFFFLILSFAAAAVRLMGLAAVAELLENVLRFIPQAISAALLLIFGVMLARFLGKSITTVAESINITYSGALGKILEYSIIIFAAVLAISALGVDTTLLTTGITIIIASAGLATALTFGLGSKEAARNVIAGYYVRQNFQPGQQITYRNYTGTIRSISGTYTKLELVSDTGVNQTVSLPNLLLIQNATVEQDTPPTNDNQE